MVYAEDIIHLYRRAMNHAYSHKVGLAVGGTAAIVHVMWSLFVFGGLAPAILKWIWGLHFVSMNVTIAPFSFPTALALVFVAGVIGYIIGYVAGELWGLVDSRKRK